MSPWIERLVSRMKLGDQLRPPDDGRRRAAVAAVLHDEPQGPRVLLMKRVERAGDPWSGHISLPGGRHDPVDPDLLATAIRETHEELGIDLSGARLLGNLPALHPMTSGPAGIEVTPFVFVTTAAVEPRPSDEAEAAFWLPVELAASGALDDTYTYPGTDRTFPSWRFEAYTIWGLTWRILGDLLVAAGPRTEPG
ncbi:MAG TPA: CoA pyrophosphatase [Kofleriaceae bacterium]|nr:CoA pyrophosphatase [Kofleriaceae bacterium]